MNRRGPAWALVVDADLVRGMVLVRRLERLGHRVTLVDDGAEALRLLACEEYDVVLLDAAFAAIQRDARTRRVPLLVTGIAPEGDGLAAWLDATLDAGGSIS